MLSIVMVRMEGMNVKDNREMRAALYMTRAGFKPADLLDSLKPLCDLASLLDSLETLCDLASLAFHFHS